MSNKAYERAMDEAVTAKCMACGEDKGDCLSCLCVGINCLTCFCFVVGAEIGCRYMCDSCIHNDKTVKSGSEKKGPPETTNTMKGTVSDIRIENIVPSC